MSDRASLTSEIAKTWLIPMIILATNWTSYTHKNKYMERRLMKVLAKNLLDFISKKQKKTIVKPMFCLISEKC